MEFPYNDDTLAWIQDQFQKAAFESLRPKINDFNVVHDRKTRYVSFTMDITPDDHLGVDHPNCWCQPIAENPTDFMTRWNAHQSAEQAERAAPRYAGKWPPPNGR